MSHRSQWWPAFWLLVGGCNVNGTVLYPLNMMLCFALVVSIELFCVIVLYRLTSACLITYSMYDAMYLLVVFIMCWYCDMLGWFWQWPTLCQIMLKLGGCIMWNAIIQYLAQSGLLSVHKLFTSCIRWCLVSRACDWVMSTLSVMLLIVSF